MHPRYKSFLIKLGTICLSEKKSFDSWYCATPLPLVNECGICIVKRTPLHMCCNVLLVSVISALASLRTPRLAFIPCPKCKFPSSGRCFKRWIWLKYLRRSRLSPFCVISFIEGLHVTIAHSVITGTKNRIPDFQNLKILLGLITSVTLRWTQISIKDY